MFDLNVRQMMSRDQVQDLWAKTVAKLGAFQHIEEIVVNEYGGNVIARARTSFSSSPIIIQLAFDRDKKIAGFYFKPVITTASYVLPDYANTDLYREEETFINAPPGQLPATFVRPVFTDRFPVVVLIQGSGPFDRDETIGPNKPFKDLAIGLATEGIATFRYDKRTYIYPEYFEEIESNLTVEQEVLQDVRAAIDLVKKIKGVDRGEIYILGHSLGGMLAPRIAKQNREVDGLIIMAGNARPLEDLILYQVQYLNSLDLVPDSQAKSLAALREQVQLLKAKQKDFGSPPDDLPLNLPPSYWRDLSAYDQLAVAKNLKEPILLLHGGRDYQVPMEDFEKWQQNLETKGNVDYIMYPTLNHIFIPGEGVSTPMEYQNPGHVPRAVVKDIAGWIKSKK